MQFCLFWDRFGSKRYRDLLWTSLSPLSCLGSLFWGSILAASCHGWRVSLFSRNLWYWTWLWARRSCSPLWRKTTEWSRLYWRHPVRSSYTLCLTPSQPHPDFHFQSGFQKRGFCHLHFSFCSRVQLRILESPPLLFCGCSSAYFSFLFLRSSACRSLHSWEYAWPRAASWDCRCCLSRAPSPLYLSTLAYKPRSSWA